MGFQQGSWTYTTQEKLTTMVEAYATADIPLEAAWMDIPYLDNYADFSINTKDWPTIGDYVKNTLHKANQKIIPILDAGISGDDTTNKYYKDATTNNLLIKSTVNTNFDSNIAITVWPQHTLFPDYFQSATSTFWQGGLSDLYKLVEFDGVWLDMNEVTGFCNGECPKGVPRWLLESDEDGQDSQDSKEEETELAVQETEEAAAAANKCTPGTDTASWYCSWADPGVESTYFLPFIPGYIAGSDSLDNNTLSLNATHVDDNKKIYTEYDVHNLYGLMEANATYQF
jgi:alpha-glucosidase